MANLETSISTVLIHGYDTHAHGYQQHKIKNTVRGYTVSVQLFSQSIVSIQCESLTVLLWYFTTQDMKYNMLGLYK